ncbi:unnamed protein product [Ilex paraguariensis]|uniref:Uncharacterized protein n=1 Tax=Ilex paraguariensis TaxID=185542 RepID=A0ABC8SLF2_9AQUA
MCFTEVVMKYFGGREISQEDLERALLVGMSPHERRRLEKKRGLSFKHSTSIIPDKDPEKNNGSGTTSTLQNTSNGDNANGLFTSNGVTCTKEDCSDLLLVANVDVSNRTSSDFGLNEEAYAAVSMDMNSNTLDSDLNSENRNLSNGALDFVHPSSNTTFSTKRDSKLSLLGHGPHGKQVVDHLLKECGEEGIRQFCQRWRQVFVEAIHPRFLPAGWDIMHSGRREFGEFSVYNPAKKAADAKDVVMKYFGGREISQEDLERALLVGMSPHERRRLEKKRGLSFKHSTSIIPDKDPEKNNDKDPEKNNGRGTTSTLQNTSNGDNANGLFTSNGVTCTKEDCSDLLLVANVDVSNRTSSDFGLNEEAYAADSMDMNSNTLDSDLNSENRNLSNGALDFVHPSSNTTFSTKRDSKLSLLGHGPHGKQLSLLGHGPHGKQVVDHLLKECGEEGIRQFCQRWRQVFVEAIHPRFLPAGWDIMHSGRREFGEFSVYNPAKKAADAKDV